MDGGKRHQHICRIATTLNDILCERETSVDRHLGEDVICKRNVHLVEGETSTEVGPHGHMAVYYWPYSVFPAGIPVGEPTPHHQGDACSHILLKLAYHFLST